MDFSKVEIFIKYLIISIKTEIFRPSIESINKQGVDMYYIFYFLLFIFDLYFFKMSQSRTKKKLPEEEFKKGITVRFNEEERKKIEEKSAIYFGGNNSKFLRYCVYKEIKNVSPGLSIGIPKEDFYAMVREINKQGTNLNQLTKFYNSGIKKEGEIFFLLKSILEKNTQINDNLIKLLDK
ncbi:hypothetical protein SAMN05421768_11222 [Chryseobacterium joostei]|uniref:Plasmid mobilization relaxosome protein MobC n=1 Tax=Chryseobacterium joostei TaxID=112234 RepID=A0A1N7KGM6_9FLAO|nr:hypothetical protein SAMN05421768_11222 [Chryseobacterium joostei]